MRSMNRLPLILCLCTLVGLLYAGGAMPQQAEVASLKSELDAIRAQINTLRSDHSNFDSKISNLNSGIDELRRDRDSLRSELDDVRNKINNARSRNDLDILRSDFDTLATSLPRGLKKDLAELKKNAIDNSRDFERIDTETSKLRQSDQEVRDAFDVLKKLVDLHSARLEQVKKQTHIKAWVP
jgi:chromosome segregation ATPase